MQVAWSCGHVACSTLCVKLQTENLSGGSSHYISFGGKSCEFKCMHASKPASETVDLLLWTAFIKFY